MDAAQRAAYLEQKGAERAEIQRPSQELAAARDAYLADARATQAAPSGDTLDQALVEAIRSLARAKNLQQ